MFRLSYFFGEFSRKTSEGETVINLQTSRATLSCMSTSKQAGKEHIQVRHRQQPGKKKQKGQTNKATKANNLSGKNRQLEQHMERKRVRQRQQPEKKKKRKGQAKKGTEANKTRAGCKNRRSEPRMDDGFPRIMRGSGYSPRPRKDYVIKTSKPVLLPPPPPPPPDYLDH